MRRLTLEDYVTQTTDPRQRYQLTMRLAALGGRQAIAQAPLPRLAAPWVAALAAQTGHDAGLWIPCYDQTVRILAAQPGSPLPKAQLGELAPAHASAPVKALLAHRKACRDSLLAQPLERHTDRTITDPRDLHAELDRARDRGYATDHGKHDPEVRAIAVPICLAGEVVSALTVSLNAVALAGQDHDTLIAASLATAAALNTHLRDANQ